MKRMAILGLLMLSACGNSAGVEAVKKIGANYNQSLEAYKECVRAKGAQSCTNEKAILDADAQRYQSTWSAINGASGPGETISSYRPQVYQPVGGGTVVRY